MRYTQDFEFREIKGKQGKFPLIFLVYKVNTLQYNVELLGSSDPDKIHSDQKKDLLSVLIFRFSEWADSVHHRQDRW